NRCSERLQHHPDRPLALGGTRDTVLDMASLKKTMFREYDIRGRESDEELNEQSIFHIAKGFAKMLRDANITECIVGHDARSTSESFHAQAMRALMES